MRASAGDPKELQEALKGVPGVIDASAYYRTSVHSMVVPNYGPGTNPQLLFIDPANPPRSWLNAEVTGTLDLPRGTIALSNSLATTLRVTTGDQVTIRNYGAEYFGRPSRSLNLTVGGVLAIAPSPFPSSNPDGFEWLSFIHIRDVDWYWERMGRPPAWWDDPPLTLLLLAEVWVDRDRFIDPYNIEGSIRGLARFERDLQQPLEAFEASISNNISNALGIYEAQSQSERVIFLMLSLPVLLLGLYLGAVGVDLSHAERRRELAVLKVRGAGGGQVLGVLILGATLGGLLATLIGLLAGVALSRLLLTVVNPFALETAPAYGDVVLSVQTVLVLVAFSVGFMLLASYRSARRTAGLPLAQTLRHYAPGETTIAYRPTTDIFLVGLGAASLLGVAYIEANPGTFLGIFAGLIFIVLLPLAPIFLIVGVTRLLTRSTGRIYGGVARLWKPLAGGLSHVIRRNLGRNPRRASNVAVIIALGLAFGMFIFAFFGSTVGNQARTIRAAIGADMIIEFPPPDDLGFVTNVSALPTVAGVSPVRSLTVDVYGRSTPTFAVDPDTHFPVTQPESWYFDGLSAESAGDLLGEPGNLLASRALVDELFLKVGDRLSVSREFFDYTGRAQDTVIVNVTVAGVVRALPGTLFAGTFGLPTTLYGSFETLAPFFPPLDELVRPFLDQPARLLVDLQPGASWREARTAVLDLGAGGVRVFEEELQRSQSDPVFRSTLGFITMEVAFMVAILTAGLGLILYAATLERDVEFAAMRARGASGWQAAGILTGEAFSIMLIGLVIGVTVGLLVAYFLLQVFVASFGTQGPLVPLLFEVPAEGFLLVGLAPLAMLLTTLLIAWRVARRNTARVLKLRGG